MVKAGVKILIIKPSSFGDIVQALPVATGLRRAWPLAEVHWLVFDAYRWLVENHPAIDRAWVVPKRRWQNLGNWREVAGWLQAVRGERYDLVLDLQGLLRSGLIAWATGSRRRLGLWSAREGAVAFYTERVLEPPPPAQEKYLEFLRYLGIEPDPYDFQIPVPPLAITALEGKRYVALHPYSRWRTKLWPWRYYEELMRQLPEEYFVLVGEGPWFPVETGNVLDLRNRLPLGQLAAVLKGAEALVSTDSGPGHLGAALGVRTLALFGATDWQKMRPIGRHVEVMRYPTPCSPCRLRTCPQLMPMACMSEIRPERVRDWLRRSLAEQRAQVAQGLLCL